MAALGPEAYDEFGLLHENAAELGLEFDQFPVGRRANLALPDGRTGSAIVWGTGPPEIVFVHGGGQNAHTWDSVVLAVGRPALAVDLPGHGHADGPAAAWPMGHADPEGIAEDLAQVVAELAPRAAGVVGLSLGGLAAIALLQRAPELVRSLVLVDITPGVVREDATSIIDFLEGPREFADFEELLARTMAHNPTRSESSLSRGILHNSLQTPSGSWMWRYRRHESQNMIGDGSVPPDSVHQWDTLAQARCPIMLLRGTRAQSVLSDDHEARFRAAVPAGRVEHIDAGHSVHSDAPREFTRLVTEFVLGDDLRP